MNTNIDADGLRTRLSFGPSYQTEFDSAKRQLQYINLKLASRGLPIVGDTTNDDFFQLGRSLLASVREKNRLLAEHLCPADQRIHGFLTSYLGESRPNGKSWLPADSLILERHGLARVLSIPPDSDTFESDIIKSYRVAQGVCHNPKHDRRTTKGVFHIAEGGLPIPADKKAVPASVYAKLLDAALDPPPELLQLPFTANQAEKAETFVSILLRPMVAPRVPGVREHKSLEIRFFAPGNLVANLDFVESIFGNAGDPFLPENDARLDIDHWTGHTGFVILAPHLLTLTKKELGLPNIGDATDKQKADGMCWESEDELYNDGTAFKLTARDNRGVICTMIADNYFGYCKKEVKTMISYAANLYGQAEEEHAGGALVFPSRVLGEDFKLTDHLDEVVHTIQDVRETCGELMEFNEAEGYGVDRKFPTLFYIPEHAEFDLRSQRVHWDFNGADREIKILPNRMFMYPNGYKVEMRQPSEGRRWRLMGTVSEGIFCHKPCTVSGGGKSEISKPITDAMLTGPVITTDFDADFDLVEEILFKDYSARYQKPAEPDKPSRPLLSPERSLGSVIKLLSINPDYTEVYNTWLEGIPGHVKEIVFIIKRFWKDGWEKDWRARFRVDQINGRPGKELKYRNIKLIASFLRIGFTESGHWRTFVLRQDYNAATKIQMEDDISASVTLPVDAVPNLSEGMGDASIKFVSNCEYRLFQRPDEAIHIGHDKTTEADFARDNGFFSNYEPVARNEAQNMVEDIIRFEKYTAPMQKRLRKIARSKQPDFFVTSAAPRITGADGTRTRNPRYLQNRPDLQMVRERHIAEVGVRFNRRVPIGQSVPFPVNAVLPGRRHNPRDEAAGIKSLAVYNPIHYQELPELFMDYIASLTGKSPSTTGAGSEGALTKAPFNALPPVVDLNNALVSYILCNTSAFVTAAGYVGPKVRVDHDISLLVPDLWCRMTPEERQPEFLIREGYLEQVKDLRHGGRMVLASRLGWRINDRFATTFLGRMFSNPNSVFTTEMLEPELQDRDQYVEGVDNIVSTMKRVAQNYFDDGSIEHACPPLQALLHIMVNGAYEGQDIKNESLRAQFTRETLLDSEWYRERLSTRQKVEVYLWEQHLEALKRFADEPMYDEVEVEMNIPDRIRRATKHFERVKEKSYVNSLIGTLGTDPCLGGPPQ